MATVLELMDRGDLERLDPQLDPDEQEYRSVFLVREVFTRLPGLLDQMESLLGIEQSPAEQLDEIFYNFTAGQPLAYPREFHEIYWRGEGFWELRTPDVRIFGFFPRKDCFVCTDIADKNLIEKYKLTSQYVEQGKRRRGLLDLDEPKWIESTEPHDVVSDWYRS
ncbi:MAG: hypothetical protein NXH88_04585 [Hyphomonas sp.]|nr:hypothetical protein [Hyphomonas sp.]